MKDITNRFWWLRLGESAAARSLFKFRASFLNFLSTFSHTPKNLKLTSKTQNLTRMMDIWSWICELPYSGEWAASDSQLMFELASSSLSQDELPRSIQLKAERSSSSDSDTSLTFSVCIEGFPSLKAPKTLWVSDTCPLSSEKPFLPLLLQLLQETITRSPLTHDSTCPRSQLQKLKSDPVEWIMDSHSPESLSSFFNLVFITRLFWLCACDEPSEVGSFYFQSLLGPSLEALTCKDAPVLRTFFISVGVDAELCFIRTFGYMLTKWLISREIGVGLQTLNPLPRQHLWFSYATEAHGFWTLKGYIPILGMKLTNFNNQMSKFPIVEAKEAVLRYALAHQQLEAVIQMDYSVGFHDGYIQVSARVNNIRLHVSCLGLGNKKEMDYAEERHFPSRIRVWVGPEVGSNYTAGLSLGRSTNNEEREVEIQRIMKGSFGKVKAPTVKARARTSTRTKIKNWRCDQDAQGNAAIFDAILCDKSTGHEIIASNHVNSEAFRDRYTGANRPFTKTGGLVFAGDEFGERVEWRVSREMEGSVLKWRIGGQVWLSYWANKVKSCYYETRFVEWCDEIDLPLIPEK